MRPGFTINPAPNRDPFYELRVVEHRIVGLIGTELRLIVGVVQIHLGDVDRQSGIRVKFIQKLTDTPAGTGFNPGVKPVVLEMSGNKIAPLICFETIAPEIVTSCVRNGGEIIVNISDLAWFHDNMVGAQTEAAAVFRAVETGRYFIYAANTGPTLVINPSGHIELKSKCGEEKLLQGKVQFLSDLTPFVQWYQ